VVHKRSTSDSSRRRFLERVIQIVQGTIAATVAFLAGGAVAAPAFTRRQETWLAAGVLDDLVDEEPTPVVIRVAREDGYAQVVDRQVVFLVKNGADSVIALSSTCTHLGCRVSWVAETQQLKCPCHGGVYDKTGAVLAGPPPAALPRLSTRVEGGQVLVQI
jgi:menaquinol-cytochrome c reductase iron-sulfur subunit